jgi:hypothetical protein
LNFLRRDHHNQSIEVGASRQADLVKLVAGFSRPLAS